MQNTKLPPYDAFCSEIRSCNLFEAEYTDYVNLLKNGMTREQAVVKLKLSKQPSWDCELSIPAKNMEAGTNELIQKLFTLL